jgi:hypothetical protein
MTESDTSYMDMLCQVADRLMGPRDEMVKMDDLPVVQFSGPGGISPVSE